MQSSVRERVERWWGVAASRARPLARTLGAQAARVARGLLHAWRRSLQLRVVAATMVLGLVATTFVAAFLANQVGERLLEARRNQAFTDSAQAAEQFQSVLNGYTEANNVPIELSVRDTLDGIADTGGDSGLGVLLLRQPGTPSPQPVSNFASDGLTTDVVPRDLRVAVQQSETQQSRSVQVRTPEAGASPGVVVGSQVAVPLAGAYELYFVVSLQREQETLDSVQRVLALGMASLVLLLGAIAFVVTRQVVTPVRQAASVAARLSDGRLDERMTQRGEDDLARLAGSFNEMATSLQQQIERMEQLSLLQRRFVSDVSHELRTPLTTIRMAGEVLHDARATFSPAVSRSAELLTNQLDRFEALLADLLEISRFDAGAAALEPEAIDVSAVVEEVLEQAAPLAERRGSELRLHVPMAPAMAEVDTRRLERIVRNLVANAIEHGEGRPIDLWVRADADAVAVLVRDQGVGLRGGDVPHVFDRFWRADPARARTTGGTGLGLAISLEDAHLHGGWLQAWGEVGLGAAFRLTLPRRAAGVLRESPLPLGFKGPGEAPGRTMRVLHHTVPQGGDSPVVLPPTLDRAGGRDG